jgi:hypothetical protein
MSKFTIEIYQDSVSGGRWRVRASNGKVIGVASESYGRIADLMTMVRELFGPKILDRSFDLHFIEDRTYKMGSGWLKKHWPEYEGAMQNFGGVSA